MKNKAILCTVILIIVFISINGWAMGIFKTKEMTVEGIYLRDLGHPFFGPALMGEGGYYRLSGDAAREIYTLKDSSKIRVSGRVYTEKRAIPEAGKFREITEKVIEVRSYEVIQ